MDLRLKTGSRPNPQWEIHWGLTGETHLYGWVNVGGLRCRVTMSRLTQGGHVEVGMGTDPPAGTYTLVERCMQLPEALIPYLHGHVEVRGITTKGVLSISEIPFVNMAEQSAWEEHYADLADGRNSKPPDEPKRDFFYHQVLAADFNQADTDAIFEGFGFRSHAELVEDHEG